MRKAVLVSLINALALFIALYFLPGIQVNSPLTLLWAGVLLGLLNLVIRPFLLLLTLPFNLLTMGLFILVVNTLILMLTAALLPGFSIHGFGTAFLASVLVTIFNKLARNFLIKLI